MGMDLDGLLPFLEARNKVRIKSGVVYPDSSAACDHYDADLVELPAAIRFMLGQRDLPRSPALI
jgi:hypothetical protein